MKEGEEEKDITESAAPETIVPQSADELPPDTQESEEQFEPFSWEASEYIHHDRDALWAIGFIAVTALFLALAILVMKSYTFAALIVVMAVALGLYARRPPHVLQYTLSPKGLHIGQKFYSFDNFKAFGLLHDGALYSVVLFPNGRFAPATHIYFAEENGEQIVDILASYLPMKDVSFDMVDTLLRRLRL